MTVGQRFLSKFASLLIEFTANEMQRSDFNAPSFAGKFPGEQYVQE